MLRFFLWLAVAIVFVAQATAQPAQSRRIRGTIETVNGNALTVKARDGTEVKIALADNFTVTAYTKKQLSDITSGSYVGVAATPQADGSQKAISISIFPESARGAGDGHRPWDLPNSTMTNGAVAETVGSADGQMLTVKYKDGEKKIVVTPATQIVTFGPGEKTEVKPGAAVVVSAITKPDGVLESSRVGVGRDGVVPN